MRASSLIVGCLLACSTPDSRTPDVGTPPADVGDLQSSDDTGPGPDVPDDSDLDATQSDDDAAALDDLGLPETKPDAGPPPCVPECDPWASECLGPDQYRICVPDVYDCPHWGAQTVLCDDGNTCDSGHCSGSCVQPEVLFLIDRSSSMGGQKWTYVENALTAVLSTTASGIRFGARVFPGNGEGCAADKLVAPEFNNAIKVFNTFFKPSESSSTPLNEALKDLDGALGTPNQSEHVVILLGGTETCADSSTLLEKITGLRARGTTVTVIGMAPGVNEALLSALAEAAGGEPFVANHDDGLISLLTTLLESFGTCCVDADKDQHGPFCAAGPDCNPLDAAHFEASCDGKECGTDGCFGSCGICPPVEGGSALCQLGSCVAQCPAHTHLCGQSCEPDDAVESCGMSCKPCSNNDNGNAECIDGLCALECNTGFHLCGDACLANDSVLRCGPECLECSTDPNGAAVCVDHTCGLVCGAGFELCGGGCAACPDDPGVAGLGCAEAGCVATACDAGYLLCGDSCCDKVLVPVAPAKGVANKGGYPSIAVSALGSVHIAFGHVSGSGGQARYASGTLADGFTAETIASSFIPEYGRYARLLLDGPGALQIAFEGGLSPSKPEIVVAEPDGASWSLTPYANKETVWQYQHTDFALAASPTGVTHVLYPSGVRLSMAYEIGFSVEKVTVAQVIDQSYSDTPAAVVDADGLVHTLYLQHQSSTKQLVYSVGGQTTWSQMEVHGAVENVGSHRFALKIHPEGGLAACFMNKNAAGEVGVYYARLDGGVWTTESVDMAGEQSCDLEIGPTGAPELVYRAQDRTLRHAWRSDAGWQSEVLFEPSGPEGARWPSMDLTGNGDLHFVFWDHDSNQVVYGIAPSG